MAYNLENYEDVDSRIHKFWEAHPFGRIDTDLVHIGQTDEGRLVQVICRARVYRDSGDLEPMASGFAEETLGSSPVNRTSFIENCETSAIGRALANAGYSTKGARPSRQEMSKAERSRDMDQGWPPPDEPDRREPAPHQKKWAYISTAPANPKQLKFLHVLLGKAIDGTDADKAAYVHATLEREIESTKDLTAGECSALIDILKDLAGE